MRRLASVLLLVLASSACFRSTTTISVRTDGSGTIVQETGMNPQTLAMLKGLAGGAAAQGGQGGAPQEFMGEAQARKSADMMGVEFVSGEPIKTATLEGYRARFAFSDIRNVKMKMNQAEGAGLGDASGGANEPPFQFGFERKGSSSLLTISVPTPKTGPGSPNNPMGPAGGADAARNEQAMQMMKTMMKGLFIDVTLAVDGRIIKTSAPHVNGSSVTLLQVDFDKLLADEGAMKKLQSATDLTALASVPGLKVISDRSVSVEFGR